MALLLATVASAQNTSVSGQIISSDGTPWVDLDVSIQNTNTGERFDVKTGADGRYSQWGLRPGTYKITIYDHENGSFTYSETHTLRGTQENDISINFSKKVGIAHPEEQRSQEEDSNRFNEVKAHFNVGVGAMLDAQSLRTQLAVVPAKKISLQEKLDSDYQTAIREFQQAEQVVSPTDVKTHAMIWGHLGEAYDYAEQYDDATNAYQKAVALRPDAAYYQNLSKAQASSAMAQSDPTVTDQELADAHASCDKAAILDSKTGARCWKNIGILLSNKGDMKQAVTPLRKSTQLDPEDAQGWFLFGRALLSIIETKQDGKAAVFPPGTAEAFQQCVDADPNGPYASQAQEILDGLVSNRTVDKTKK